MEFGTFTITLSQALEEQARLRSENEHLLRGMLDVDGKVQAEKDELVQLLSAETWRAKAALAAEAAARAELSAALAELEAERATSRRLMEELDAACLAACSKAEASAASMLARERSELERALASAAAAQAEAEAARADADEARSIGFCIQAHAEKARAHAEAAEKAALKARKEMAAQLAATNLAMESEKALSSSLLAKKDAAEKEAAALRAGAASERERAAAELAARERNLRTFAVEYEALTLVVESAEAYHQYIRAVADQFRGLPVLQAGRAAARWVLAFDSGGDLKSFVDAVIEDNQNAWRLACSKRLAQFYDNSITASKMNPA
jgi:hypothetical protein